jgi:phytanoyl-CoA hydroxylase
MLTPQQVEQYEDQGFLVIPAFTPPAQVAALQARGVALAEAHAPAARAATFSTSSQNNTTDAYFQESANNVSVFFEEGAFGPNGALLRPPPFAQSVNKLGHALHDVDEIFRTWARSPAVAAVLRALGYKRPLIVQSMYHMKPAGVGSEVA